MKRTVVKKIIVVPASDAWEVISELTGVESYLPAVSSSEVFNHAGKIIRSINLLDGSHYEEVISRIDEENMELHYAISDPSPFPYSKLKGKIKITPVNEKSCEVLWSCCYDPENGPAEEMDVFLTLIISLGIRSIEKLCKKMMAYG